MTAPASVGTRPLSPPSGVLRGALRWAARSMHDLAVQTRAADGAPPVDDAVERAARLRPIVRGFQEEAERERRIPAALLEQLRAAGLYRMLVPRQLGGLQLDLLSFLRVVEHLSEGD